MNFDTDELAFAAHQIWVLSRTTFLEKSGANKSGASDIYYHKFFARLQSAEGYRLILKHMAEQKTQSPHQFVSACAYILKSLPVTHQFCNELLGLESKANEKENVNAFAGYLTTVLEMAGANRCNAPLLCNPVSAEDTPLHILLQSNIENFIATVETSYEWETSWQIVCNKYAEIIEHNIDEYLASAGVLSATVLSYLLHHHVAYEGQSAALRLSIGSDLPRSIRMFKPETPIAVDEYTMRKCAARAWEHILSSTKWDAECLTKGLQHIFTPPEDPAIAFSSKKRHNK